MKFIFETMRFLLKHITLNQQITLTETFHTYFTTFQITAPRRITKGSTPKYHRASRLGGSNRIYTLDFKQLAILAIAYC